MTQQMFTVQTRDDRGRWQQSKFARPMTEQAARELADQLDEHGSDARVASFKR
jgi:hypothetical protein